jgi:hypothetical protein
VKLVVHSSLHTLPANGDPNLIQCFRIAFTLALYTLATLGEQPEGVELTVLSIVVMNSNRPTQGAKIAGNILSGRFEGGGDGLLDSLSLPFRFG